jgi:hypothetical protein
MGNQRKVNGMKRLVLLSMLILSAGAVYAQEKAAGEQSKAESKTVKREAGKYAYKYFIEMEFGASFLGGIKGETLKTGTGGIPVNDINFANTDGYAGFMMDIRFGVSLLDWLTVAGTLGFDSARGSVNTAHSDTHSYNGGGLSIIAYDKIAAGFNFFRIDASAIFTLLPTTTPFFVNPGAGIGYAFSFDDKKHTDRSALRYEAIVPNTWPGSYYGKDEPSPDYTSIPLLGAVEGIYFKPSIEVGLITSGKSKVRFAINGQVKIFPALFGKERKVTINDGESERDVTITMPRWFVPSVAFSMGYAR